jgi:CubicO group peptidase (beta-lactamase class C family)
MTSNLPNYTKHPPAEVDPWGSVGAPQLFAALKRQSPHGWPNTFEYSNTGYFLLAHIIEAVALNSQGRPPSSREFVRRTLLEPGRMLHTGFVGEPPPGTHLAAPHYRRRPAFAQPHWLDGCGDMTSDVVDLFAWNKALMENRLISTASRDAMFSDAARVDPITYYGMGWFIRHEEEWDSFYHSGSVPGFTSYNAILLHRGTGRWLSVTLLTNSDGVEGLDQLGDDILGIARERPQ